jgi:hypothetical protein
VVPHLSDFNDLDSIPLRLRKKIKAFPGDASRWALCWSMGLPCANVPRKFRFLVLSIREQDRVSDRPWKPNWTGREAAIVNMEESMQGLKNTFSVSLTFWSDEMRSLIKGRICEISDLL